MNLKEELRVIMKTHELNDDLKLKIKTIEGDVVTGSYDGYTQALDNDVDQASISIQQDGYIIELYENDIEFIKVV